MIGGAFDSRSPSDVSVLREHCAWCVLCCLAVSRLAGTCMSEWCMRTGRCTRGEGDQSRIDW